MTNRRNFLKAGGLLAMGIPFHAGMGGAALAAPARGPNLDPMALIDPELRPIAALLLKDSAKYPPLSRQTLQQTRNMTAVNGAPPLDNAIYAERRIAGIRGNPDVTLYVVNAKPGSSRPGIVYLHGGGFIFGDAKSSIRELHVLTTALDCCAVAVDYRLAPETPYPGSVEDNYAGLRWMYAHAEELGVDPARIAVMGESAGGGHAALLAIAARDRGEVPVIFQMLIYPMLDDRTGSSVQVPKHMGTVIWDAQANRYGWEAFLGQKPGGKTVSVGAVPARVANLCGLPSTFIGVGSLDLFVNEDIDYARRLVDVGVATELHVIPSVFHGFDHFETATAAKHFNAIKLDALRRAFQSPSPA